AGPGVAIGPRLRAHACVVVLVELDPVLPLRPHPSVVVHAASSRTHEMFGVLLAELLGCLLDQEGRELHSRSPHAFAIPQLSFFEKNRRNWRARLPDRSALDPPAPPLLSGPQK